VIAGSAITLAPEIGGEEPGPSLHSPDEDDQGLLPYPPAALAGNAGNTDRIDVADFDNTSFDDPFAAAPAAPATFNAPAFGLRSSFEPPQQHAAPVVAPDVDDEPPSFDASYPHAAPLAPEEEPFAPEPFEPEPFDPADLDADEDDPQELPLLSFEEPEAEPEDATSLYDTIAAPEEDGVPGPIGIAPSAFAWGDDDDETSAADADEEDEETTRLLRNAAAAGYHLPDDDELLLEEAVEEEGEPGKGSGWLPNLLEDES
jgi:hypothetical protein